MRFPIWMMVLGTWGCAQTVPVPETPDRLPISESVEAVVTIPKYVETTKGNTAPLLEGEVAPFSGILLDETKAFGAAELRIAYEELYRLSGVQKAAFGVSLRIMEQELQRADAEIAQKDAVLRELRDSWWSQHKMSVGIITGVVLGVSGSFAAGVIWSKIDE